MERAEGAFVELDEVAQSEPVDRMAREIIRRALLDGASLVRVEPMGRSVRVTCCVDRITRDLGSLPRTLQIPLISCLREMAGLVPNGDGFSEQGEFWARVQGQDYHLMLFTTPTELGEGVVIQFPL